MHPSNLSICNQAKAICRCTSRLSPPFSSYTDSHGLHVWDNACNNLEFWTS
uniref:Uncharacterized protein n=1 Tax=Setaria italica TaxID=4555 RepID=K4A3T0_SETIT